MLKIIGKMCAIAERMSATPGKISRTGAKTFWIAGRMSGTEGKTFVTVGKIFGIIVLDPGAEILTGRWVVPDAAPEWDRAIRPDQGEVLVLAGVEEAVVPVAAARGDKILFVR